MAPDPNPGERPLIALSLADPSSGTIVDVMRTLWKILCRSRLVLPLGAFVAGSLVASAADDPPVRDTIVIRESGGTPSPTPSRPPTRATTRARPGRRPQRRPVRRPTTTVRRHRARSPWSRTTSTTTPATGTTVGDDDGSSRAGNGDDEDHSGPGGGGDDDRDDTRGSSPATAAGTTAGRRQRARWRRRLTSELTAAGAGRAGPALGPPAHHSRRRAAHHARAGRSRRDRLPDREGPGRRRRTRRRIEQEFAEFVDAPGATASTPRPTSPSPTSRR